MAGASIPAMEKPSNAFTWVTDIAPTILELAGVKPPSGRYGGHPVEPMIGRSLLRVARGESDRVYSPQRP